MKYANLKLLAICLKYTLYFYFRLAYSLCLFFMKVHQTMLFHLIKNSTLYKHLQNYQKASKDIDSTPPIDGQRYGVVPSEDTSSSAPHDSSVCSHHSTVSSPQ